MFAAEDCWKVLFIATETHVQQIPQKSQHFCAIICSQCQLRCEAAAAVKLCCAPAVKLSITKQEATREPYRACRHRPSRTCKTDRAKTSCFEKRNSNKWCSDIGGWKQCTWKKEVATEARASAGHSRNQSMVQQLTRAGNMRSRCLQKIIHTCIGITTSQDQVLARLCSSGH